MKFQRWLDEVTQHGAIHHATIEREVGDACGHSQREHRSQDPAASMDHTNAPILGSLLQLGDRFASHRLAATPQNDLAPFTDASMLGAPRQPRQEGCHPQCARPSCRAESARPPSHGSDREHKEWDRAQERAVPSDRQEP